MKSQRLAYAPTRSRRLNEIFGLAVVAAAGLLLLSLLTYNASDPSLNTAAGGMNPAHPARNWTGLLGAYIADLTLQTEGIAALLLPLVIARVGVSWIRSRAVGAGWVKLAGVLLWLLFAPAGAALLPLHFLWKGALPPAGAEGPVVAGALVHLLNAPGAAILTVLTIALSLYLTTSFALRTAPQWFTGQFAFLRSGRESVTHWRQRRSERESTGAGYEGKRMPPDEAESDAVATQDGEASQSASHSNSLLAGLLQLFSRKKAKVAALIAEPEPEGMGEPPSVWESMPRTNVDTPSLEGLAAASAAAAPFAAQLAAQSAPVRSGERTANGAETVHSAEGLGGHEPPIVRRDAAVEDDGWLNAPERTSFRPLLHEAATAAAAAAAAAAAGTGPHLVRRAAAAESEPSPFPVPSPFPDPAPMPDPTPSPEPFPAPLPAALRDRGAPLPRPVAATVAAPLAPLASLAPSASRPASPSPMADLRDQNMAFGARADAHQLRGFQPVKSVKGYELPPSTLLHQGGNQTVVREDALRAEAQVLVEKCAEFGVAGRVEQINPGPVVTTYEFRPDAGVKYSRVTGLADDLCLAMAAESVLIERMAGKSTVGIQVPNPDRETIWLRDVVESPDFASPTMRLPIALGKDIDGRIVTADLASMPHVLIAGSTGSGKSVAINAMIMSVLFRSTPEQVRMILVDPKRVELGMYEGIPHLFTPIITEAKLAANALKNAVREMERRLKLLAANHVRNLDQFNHLFDPGSDHVFEDRNQEPLPYIIIVIDELADLMMLDRSNVEEAITRLAQMARAVGIHLVLATQRPSVDVITGLLKANVPTRMSFRLATKIDSRTIIDTNGAEALLGRGDMLFLPPGTSRLQRVHAPFVTEKEIAGVTAFWKAQGEANYVEGFLDGPKDDKGEDGSGAANEGAEADPMFDDAVRLVFEFGKASTSLLQRRLRIGYGRAAHLIDTMERDGLVGPADGSKPRELLKPPSYFSEVDAAIR